MMTKALTLRDLTFDELWNAGCLCAVCDEAPWTQRAVYDATVLICADCCAEGDPQPEERTSPPPGRTQRPMKEDDMATYTVYRTTDHATIAYCPTLEHALAQITYAKRNVDGPFEILEAARGIRRILAEDGTFLRHQDPDASPPPPGRTQRP